MNDTAVPCYDHCYSTLREFVNIRHCGGLLASWAGLVQSAYHTGYCMVISENLPDCESVCRGTFGAGVAFALITGVLTGCYYYSLSKARVAYNFSKARRLNVSSTAMDTRYHTYMLVLGQPLAPKHRHDGCLAALFRAET